VSKKGSKCCNEWLSKGMCAILPRYEPDGTNGSDILFEDGKRLTHKRKVRMVIKELAGLYQKDLTLIRGHAAQELGQKSMLPIYINPAIVLVPFKTRKPIGKDDGALGYVFESAVLSMDEANIGTQIKLKGELLVVVFENIKTAKRHMDNAARVRKNAVQYGLRQEQLSSAWNQLREEYEQPATRGDIAILSRSLMNLIEKLRV